VNQGNPFFLEEIVRTLAETKVLEGSSGNYRLIRPIEAVQVPATVQVILASRIDRLSLEDKHLLQIAAVIGRRVPFFLLQAVADVPDEALRDGLDRLQSAEFVFETGLFPDLEYSFKHAITQEVTYGGILQDRRRELHAQIVNSIETLHHNRLGEHVELLAYHTVRGELREKAVSYLFQAGVKAAKHSAPDNAEDVYEQALALLEALPDTRYKLEQSFEIRLEMRSVLSILGETRLASQRLREAESFAESLNDERRLGRVSAMMASNDCQLAELDAAFANGTRALTIAERIADSTLRSTAVSNLAMLYYYRAEYERTVEVVTTDLARGPDDLGFYASSAPGAASLPGPISTHCWRIRSLAELGRFSVAGAYAHEIIRLAEPTRGAFPIGMAHLAAGWYFLAQGNWAQARDLIERGVAEYRKGNIILALPHAVASSARLLAQLGESSEALNRLQEGEELLEWRIAAGTIDQAGMDYHWLGRAALLLDKSDDAQRLANCSLQYSPSHPGFAAHALHLLGDISTYPEQFSIEEGNTFYRKALALAEPRGMRPLIAHCHFGLSKLYRRTDKHEQAREHLTTATSMYREMDMRFYLEQAEAESSLIV
jgi:tetratricopeptide (TPR) repeat protein